MSTKIKDAKVDKKVNEDKKIAVSTAVEEIESATPEATIKAQAAANLAREREERECRASVRRSKAEHMRAFGQKATLKSTTKKVADVFECIVTDPLFYDLSSVHTINIGKTKISLPTLNVKQIVAFIDKNMGTKLSEEIKNVSYLSIPTLYKFFTQVFNFTCDPVSGKFIQARLYDRLNSTQPKANQLRTDSGHLALFDDYARHMLKEHDATSWDKMPMIQVSDSIKSTLRKYFS